MKDQNNSSLNTAQHQTSVIDYTNYPLPRSRHHTAPTLYLPYNNLHTDKIHYYPPIPEAISWKDIFSDGQPPCSLDIGCGMGKFLLEYGKTTPQDNILGIEVRKQWIEWIQGVIDGEELRNVGALWYSVVNGLHFIEDNSINSIFYFFPDPWVKKRHHKRRAFTVDFLNELSRVMVRQGKLFLMTDVPEVDEYQQEVLNDHGGFIMEVIDDDDKWPLHIRTNQERFSLSKDIPYTRLLCTKK
jgi:tRNA (guanine-N7-)-methyltransferase